jgi:two-component system, NarL family, response regulator LiaR
MSDKPYKVVIVEDHALTRVGLHTALNASADIEVIGEADDGLDALGVIRDLRPNVVVADIGLPGIDGIELTRRIRAEFPDTRVVILTVHDLESEILDALEAGADAYCVKMTDTSAVLLAVRAAAEGGAYFDPHIADAVLRRFRGQKLAAPASPLSVRETEIVRLIAEGYGNVAIAEQLNLGLGTVKGHIREILDKLKASDRAQAAVTALRRGII